MAKDKELCFVVRDEGLEADIITGGVLHTAAYIKEYLKELLRCIYDGEEITVTIKRHDMTKEELSAVPEV